MSVSFSTIGLEASLLSALSNSFLSSAGRSASGFPSCSIVLVSLAVLD